MQKSQSQIEETVSESEILGAFFTILLDCFLMQWQSLRLYFGVTCEYFL